MDNERKLLAVLRTVLEAQIKFLSMLDELDKRLEAKHG